MEMVMCRCEIQWIDGNGKATPDENPAIGRVRIVQYTMQFHGRAITYPTTRWYPICSEHAKQLGDRGMHIWEFEAFTVYHPEVA
jgi:hypothetical protein